MIEDNYLLDLRMWLDFTSMKMRFVVLFIFYHIVRFKLYDLSLHNLLRINYTNTHTDHVCCDCSRKSCFLQNTDLLNTKKIH